MASFILGGIYYVLDTQIRLPPDGEREIHDSRRPFVVLSTSLKNNDPGWPVVLGCPISSSTKFYTEFCVKLGAGQAGMPKKTWIRVPALQPLAKSDLQDHIGLLTPELLETLQARVLQYIGLV